MAAILLIPIFLVGAMIVDRRREKKNRKIAETGSPNGKEGENSEISAGDEIVGKVPMGHRLHVKLGVERRDKCSYCRKMAKIGEGSEGTDGETGSIGKCCV